MRETKRKIDGIKSIEVVTGNTFIITEESDLDTERTTIIKLPDDYHYKDVPIEGICVPDPNSPNIYEKTLGRRLNKFIEHRLRNKKIIIYAQQSISDLNFLDKVCTLPILAAIYADEVNINNEILRWMDESKILLTKYDKFDKFKGEKIKHE